MATGDVVRDLRLARGWSQDRLAIAFNTASGNSNAPITRENVSRWENGKRRLTPRSRELMAKALGVPVEALEEPPLDPLRIAHEWLVSESPQVRESRAGRRVGAAFADQLEARVIELRLLDDHLAGKDLAPVVTKELRESTELVKNAAYAEPIGQRLLTSVGELAQLAGWVASDAGQHAKAQTYYLSGVEAATQAGDKGLAGNLLSSLSYQIANTADPADALLLARSAAMGARDTPPAVRALLLERVAWAAARSRDAEAAARILDQVDDVFESRSKDDEEPEWVYWLTRDEVDTMRARCAVELGNPAKAEELLVPVLSRYPDTSNRENALYWSWLSEAYARSGDLEQAHATLDRVRDFAETVNSQRVDDRITAVETLLALPS